MRKIRNTILLAASATAMTFTPITSFAAPVSQPVEDIVNENLLEAETDKEMESEISVESNEGLLAIEDETTGSPSETEESSEPADKEIYDYKQLPHGKERAFKKYAVQTQEKVDGTAEIIVKAIGLEYLHGFNKDIYVIVTNENTYRSYGTTLTAADNYTGSIIVPPGHYISSEVALADGDPNEAFAHPHMVTAPPGETVTLEFPLRTMERELEKASIAESQEEEKRNDDEGLIWNINKDYVDIPVGPGFPGVKETVKEQGAPLLFYLVITIFSFVAGIIFYKKKKRKEEEEKQEDIF